ncbi:MAG: MBL fold metallo-hydrolase, partial [Deltaproteobacteria bacterium]|nr:MBL fold metallo-hydrolase [Deltaproteobacteria bacterium]
FDLHEADPAALNQSLTRLGELEVSILLPGHNRIDDNVPAGYITETARQWAPDLV